MAHDWFLVRADKELGPLAPQQIKEMAADGRLSPADLVRRTGMAVAVRAGSVKGLYPSPPPLPSATPTGTKRPRTFAGRSFLISLAQLTLFAVALSGVGGAISDFYTPIFPWSLIMCGGSACILLLLLLMFAAFRGQGLGLASYCLLLVAAGFGVWWFLAESKGSHSRGFLAAHFRPIADLQASLLAGMIALEPSPPSDERSVQPPNGLADRVGPKVPGAGDNVAAQTAPQVPKRPERDDQSGQQPADDKEVVEWVNHHGTTEFYSEKLIPILYGVPDAIVREMPTDQRRLFESIERLGAEVSEAAKTETNPALRQRLIEKTAKQSAALTVEQNIISLGYDPNTRPPKNWVGKNPLKGWVGQIRIGSTEATVSIGTASRLTRDDIFYDRTSREDKKKPPPKNYWSGDSSLMTIIIDTQVMSDGALAQFKGLKDGDWVRVDLPDTRWGVSALVGFLERKGELQTVYGYLSVRESAAARYKKPRAEEPVIRKLSVLPAPDGRGDRGWFR